MSTIKNNNSLLFKNRLTDLIGKNVSVWAKKMGFTEQSVHKWRRGSIPGADKIMIICQKENISADWLLTGKEHTPAKHFNENAEIKQLKETLELKQEILDVIRENAQLLKDENTRLKDKIKNLEKNFLKGRRGTDPQELNTAKLRKQAM